LFLKLSLPRVFYALFFTKNVGKWTLTDLLLSRFDDVQKPNIQTMLAT